MKRKKSTSFIALCVCALFSVSATSAERPDTPGDCKTAGGTWDVTVRQPTGYCVLDTQKQCISGGGTWTRVCMAQSLACIKNYKDGQKACSDGTECEGKVCLDIGNKANDKGLVFGLCVPNNDPCGTFQHIVRGKRGLTINVD